MKGRGVLLAVLAVLLFSAVGVLGREARKDAETGRVRVLYIGDAWGPTPFFDISSEPSFAATPIPATYAHTHTYNERQLRQFMRIYMPRTYRDLVTKYDVIILSDTNRGLFRLGQLEMFRRAVEEEGLGILMVGGIEAFGGDSGYPSWGNSPVEEALPVFCLRGQTYRNDFFVESKYPDDPFIKSLPWKTMPPFHGMNVVDPKEGAKILLNARISKKYPVLVYWNFGKGVGLAHMPDWTPAWGASIMKDWNFYPDYVANMVFLCAGAKIPQNPILMHELRTRFERYYKQRALAISLMEFIETFGAKVTTVEDGLSKIGDMEKEAERLYLKQDYNGALQTLKDTDKEFHRLSQEMVKLKERALMWVYIVEWLAVSGTAMVCGVVVWMLMVRRRLYKEVEITRAT